MLKKPKLLDDIFKKASELLVSKIELFLRAFARQFIFGNFSNDSKTYIFQIETFTDIKNDQIGKTDYRIFENHESEKNIINNEKKHTVLIISSLIALGLLIIFSIMQLFDSKVLALDNKWLIVSGIPILVGLFLSGVIKSFKGFGVELETNLAEKIDLELVGKVESFPTPEITKQSMQFLIGMSPNQKSKIERLQFEYGKLDYYDSYVVKEYIANLTRLRYIEIIDNDGRFVGLLPVGQFKEDRAKENFDRIINNIKLLIRSIERKNIPDSFKNFITDKIKKDDTLLEAFKKFNISGLHRIGVYNFI